LLPTLESIRGIVAKKIGNTTDLSAAGSVKELWDPPIV
jgi:hypothetical protein